MLKFTNLHPFYLYKSNAPYFFVPPKIKFHAITHGIKLHAITPRKSFTLFFLFLGMFNLMLDQSLQLTITLLLH